MYSNLHKYSLVDNLATFWPRETFFGSFYIYKLQEFVICKQVTDRVQAAEVVAQNVLQLLYFKLKTPDAQGSNVQQLCQVREGGPEVLLGCD